MNASREKPPLITKERSQEPKKREMTQKVAQKMPQMQGFEFKKLMFNPHVR